MAPPTLFGVNTSNAPYFFEAIERRAGGLRLFAGGLRRGMLRRVRPVGKYDQPGDKAEALRERPKRGLSRVARGERVDGKPSIPQQGRICRAVLQTLQGLRREYEPNHVVLYTIKQFQENKNNGPCRSFGEGAFHLLLRQVAVFFGFLPRPSSGHLLEEGEKVLFTTDGASADPLHEGEREIDRHPYGEEWAPEEDCKADFMATFTAAEIKAIEDEIALGVSRDMPCSSVSQDAWRLPPAPLKVLALAIWCGRHR